MGLPNFKSLGLGPNGLALRPRVLGFRRKRGRPREQRTLRTGNNQFNDVTHSSDVISGLFK